jgi:hypothetical protein
MVASRTHGREEKWIQNVSRKTPKKREHLEELCADDRTVLKLIS